MNELLSIGFLVANILVLGINLLATIKLYTECQKLRVLRNEEP